MAQRILAHQRVLLKPGERVFHASQGTELFAVLCQRLISSLLHLPQLLLQFLAVAHGQGDDGRLA